ncbi:hypothetical protein I316_02944 [Kwoniella heveanensis BCC8398]|uniref:Uncharacterized protein n=1 Tax=Kwoniella heveanensis BCC8398 TaxID=1296120 RepID=A0A1B9GWI2_9TREE|nr:hypothetical protein I316_02944 [Kwoniella heveanensis BCC8398]
MSSISTTSTTFLLEPPSAASSSSTTGVDLPESPALSLLPFSLGSNALPYTSVSAPVAKYFKPRPYPHGLRPESKFHTDTDLEHKSESASAASLDHSEEVLAGNGTGTRAATSPTVASFRGRQVVGQYIEVPKGWKGLILSASKRPDRGGAEVHADSSASSFSMKKESTVAKKTNEIASHIGNDDDDDGTAMRRTTRSAGIPAGSDALVAGGGRVRGAGQVALSRPRTRQGQAAAQSQPLRGSVRSGGRTAAVQVQTKKRFRLDSDSEDEKEGEGEGHRADAEPSSSGSSTLTRTPSKRVRNTYSTPQKSSGSTTVFVSEVDIDTPASKSGTILVPEIVIQEATPLKHPLPTPKKRLSQRRRPSPPPPIALPIMREKEENVVEGSGGCHDVIMEVEVDVSEGSAETQPYPPSQLGCSESMDIVEQQLNEGSNSAAVMGEKGNEPFQSAVSDSEEKETGSQLAEKVPETLDDRAAATAAEEVIPSPATEDDPPSFNVLTPTSSSTNVASTNSVSAIDDSLQTHNTENGNVSGSQQSSIEAGSEQPISRNYDGPLRILRPTSTFKGFMLYTPDAPLAGFRADELSVKANGEESSGKAEDVKVGQQQEIKVERASGSTAPEEAEAGAEAAGGDGAVAVSSGIQVRKGWWRVGGAGEGGDEIVRSMGEWLGLLEVVS